MYFTREFTIGLSMLGQNTYISNKGFLAILQDIAEMHSASVGFGVTDIYTTNRSWALLNWKVKFINRPKYGDTITIKTWSRYSTKLYSYRDFEIYDSNQNLIAIASSKWILIDLCKGKIAKLEDDIMKLYEREDKSVFGIVEIDKLNEPETLENTINYNIRKADIDVNNHVNNLCYIDMALEAFPRDVNEFNSCTELEVMYKHQIKIDDDIQVSYTYENGENYIVIKNDNGTKLNSIIKFS